MSKYIDSLTKGLFSPIFSVKSASEEERPLYLMIFHLVVMTLLGWLSFAWLFVRRYYVLQYFSGDINSPARVLAYETNLVFMFEMFGIIIVLMWVFPILLQLLIHKMQQRENVDIKKIAYEVAFTTPNFSLLVFPILLILTWGNTFDMFMGMNDFWQGIVYFYFWCALFWSFLSTSFRMSSVFNISLKNTIWHIWIPVIFLILGLAGVII